MLENVIPIEARALEQLDRLAEQRNGRGQPLAWEQIEGDVARTYRNGGLPRGDTCGWNGFDELFSVAPHQWTVVTGVPNVGKSEFLDAMLVRLAERSGWTFALYSPENFPVSSHAIKLLEKRNRKPFGDGPTSRMTQAEMRRGMAWIKERFSWIDAEPNTLIDLVRVGLRDRPAGVKRGVVIDPWNTLDHHGAACRRPAMTETEYVSAVLTELTNILRGPDGDGAHVFLVAHPQKMYRDRDGKYHIPTGYDIAGSAHFFNKADNIICVHREKGDHTQEVQIIMQKVRFKHVGKYGATALRYDKVIGTYFEWPGSDGEFYADPERGSVPREPGEDDE